jgi:hypothetical protein
MQATTNYKEFLHDILISCAELSFYTDIEIDEETNGFMLKLLNFLPLDEYFLLETDLCSQTSYEEFLNSTLKSIYSLENRLFGSF